MRRIVIVAFPGVQTLDVVNPAEVFSTADRLASGGEYGVEVVAASGGVLTTGSGLQLLPHRGLSGVRGPIGTLMVAGGTGVADAMGDERLVRRDDAAGVPAPVRHRPRGLPQPLSHTRRLT